MSRFYVRLKNGQVAHRPLRMSGSHSDSPNAHWTPEQLKLHNIVEVDIDHDPQKEYIDYEHPVVDGNKVTYNKISYTPEKILSIAKGLKTRSLYNSSSFALSTKYPNHIFLGVAMRLFTQPLIDKIKSDVQNIYSYTENKRTEIIACQTKEAVDAIVIDFKGV